MVDHGRENIKFMIPMLPYRKLIFGLGIKAKLNTDESIMKLCVINDKYSKSVTVQKTIQTIITLDSNDSLYGSETFTTDEFVSLINKGE